MFLNSVILGNILNHEKCELKNSIDAYIDKYKIIILNNIPLYVGLLYIIIQILLRLKIVYYI
jgi:hypothetical protein